MFDSFIKTSLLALTVVITSSCSNPFKKWSNTEPDSHKEFYATNKSKVKPHKFDEKEFHSSSIGIVKYFKNTRDKKTGRLVFPVSLWDDNEYFNVELKYKKDIQIINNAIKNKKEIGIVVAQDAKFIVVGKKKNISRDDGATVNHDKLEYWDDAFILKPYKKLTIAQVKENPDLVSTSISSNGIMSNKDESTRNAIMQLGGFDKSGKITVMYDKTAKGQKNGSTMLASFGGFLTDTFEGSINQFGGGFLVTGGTLQDREFLRIVINNARQKNKKITLSGHSAGGRRNYVNLLNSEPSFYLGKDGNCLLDVQFYGTPVNKEDILEVASYLGVKVNDVQVNNGDFVGSVLGMNTGNKVAQNVNTSSGFWMMPFKKSSSHSEYYCEGKHCNFNKS